MSDTLMETSELIGQPSDDTFVLSIETSEADIMQQLKLAGVTDFHNIFDVLDNSSLSSVEFNMDDCKIKKTPVELIDDSIITDTKPPVLPLFVQEQQLDALFDGQEHFTYWPPDHVTSQYQFVYQSSPSASGTTMSSGRPASVETSLCPAGYNPTQQPVSTVTSLVCHSSPEFSDQTVPHTFQHHQQQQLTDRRTTQDSDTSSTCYDVNRDELYGPLATNMYPTVVNHPDLITSSIPASAASRKRCYQTNANVTELQDPSTVKKERRKAQNRKAATRCRIKRRNEFETLKKNYDGVLSDNDRLRSRVTELTKRYDTLQRQLLQHQVNCNFRFNLTS